MCTHKNENDNMPSCYILNPTVLTRSCSSKIFLIRIYKTFIKLWSNGKITYLTFNIGHVKIFLLLLLIDTECESINAIPERLFINNCCEQNDRIDEI